jgi:hypothetical protein
MKLLSETYQDKISFTLSCYDRIIINGTLPEISYAQGMTSYMFGHDQKIFDYPRFANPMKAVIKENAERIVDEVLY